MKDYLSSYSINIAHTKACNNYGMRRRSMNNNKFTKPNPISIKLFPLSYNYLRIHLDSRRGWWNWRNGDDLVVMIMTSIVDSSYFFLSSFFSLLSSFLSLSDNYVFHILISSSFFLSTLPLLILSTTQNIYIIYKYNI